jgi:hypothetical protein
LASHPRDCSAEPVIGRALALGSQNDAVATSRVLSRQHTAWNASVRADDDEVVTTLENFCYDVSKNTETS